jgi:hypothetical protein
MKIGWRSLQAQLLAFACVLCAIQHSEASQLKPEKMLATTAQSTIGPFELSSADSSSRIRFQFATQLRMFFESDDQGPSNRRAEKLVMEARRIRPTLTGSLMKPSLSFKLHLSAAPHSIELMDFYFNYRIRSHLQFRFGQFKTPFTRYRIQSFQRLTFVDWSVVTRYFGAERQMGFAVHNGYELPEGLSYVAGLFTGVNARASHAVGLPELYGIDVSNPSDLAGSGPKAEFHPELFLHVAHNSKGIDIGSDSDEQGGSFRYSAGLSIAWDTDPVIRQDLTARVAPELLIKYWGASASFIGYAGYGEVGDPARTRLLILSGLAQTAYRITRCWEVSARYVVIDLRNALLYDVLEKTGKPIRDQILREHETTIGLNIYLIGHDLKWQNDTVWLRHKYGCESKDDIMVRSQFQLAF